LSGTRLKQEIRAAVAPMPHHVLVTIRQAKAVRASLASVAALARRRAFRLGIFL
jgi:hypothetical protein